LYCINSNFVLSVFVRNFIPFLHFFFLSPFFCLMDHLCSYLHEYISEIVSFGSDIVIVIIFDMIAWGNHNSVSIPKERKIKGKHIFHFFYSAPNIESY